MMKISDIRMRTTARGRLEWIDVFGAYYNSGDEEGFFFKLATKKAVIAVARACKSMRIYAHYTLQEESDVVVRDGYINRKWCLWMYGRDEAFICIDDVKRIISEMFEAQHYQLHWIPVRRLLNLKTY